MASSEINSILDSIKKKLGLSPKVVTDFDADLIDAINMALNTLTQIGVGPSEGFTISGNSKTWKDFLGTDKRLNMAKTYVYIKTRLVFDPPQSSFVLTALQEQAKELEWRLNVQVDSPKTSD